MRVTRVESSTKLLVPRRQDDIIPRQRLTDLLHGRIHLRAQVVSAPAGYGKTTLLVDFTDDVGAPACWYSLDEFDQDPRLLLEGIIASIRSVFPGSGQTLESRLTCTQDVVAEAPQLIGALTGEMYSAIPEYFVLVLEDCHLVEESSPASTLLDLLVERAPDNCHIILSSRSSVELPSVSRLIFEQRAAVLSTSDLAFTRGEVRELLAARHGLDLSDEEAARLASSSEGWALGILLSTHGLREGRLPGGLHALSHWDVSRYLALEVFDRQPSEVQSFLLASATVTDMTPEICDHLRGTVGSRKELQEIERRNLFVYRIDGRETCHRYHHLFREFLQVKLREENPEQFALLHCRAASFYEEGCRWNDAVTHLLSGGEHTGAVRIIKSVGEEFVNSGKWATVSKWISSLPGDIRARDPDLILLHAQAMVHVGDVDSAARSLTDLLAGPDGSDWLREATALSWRSAAYRLGGHFAEAKKDVKTAILLLEQHEGPPRILGDAHRRMGNIHMEQGRFNLALKHMRRALKCYTAVSDVGRTADMHNSLGVVHKRLGDLAKANVHFEHAREGWQKVGNLGALALTLNNIGMVYHRRGQYDLALDTFHSGLSKARETGYRRAEALILINVAEVLRDAGSYDEALAKYNDGLELAGQVMEPYYVSWAKAGMGQTYRLAGDLDKAEVLLTEAIAQAQEHEQSYEATLFETQLGIIQYERGQYEAAMLFLGSICDRLETIGDKDALARACFHLGQAAFLAKRLDVAVEWVEKAVGLADDLGYDDFLAVEGRDAVPLVQYAASRRVDEERLAHVMEKIRKRRDRRRARATTSVNAESPTETKPDIKVHALGETRVLMNGRPTAETEWRSSRAKELFFYLLHRGVGQTREQVAAALWPELPPGKASSNFHINLYRARRATYPGVFTLEQGQYKLNGDLNIWFDARELEHLLDQAGVVPDALCAVRGRELEQAVELYRGPFMDEFYSEWVEQPRHQYEDRYLKALLSLARFHGELGRYDVAVALLEKFVAIDPYADDVYCQVMEYHLATGDRACALRTYRRYVDAVANEGETELVPSVRARELYRRALIDRRPD